MENIDMEQVRQPEMKYPITLLTTLKELNDVKKTCTEKAIVILFWAEWDDRSDTLRSMMEEMPKVYKNIHLAYINCDDSEEMIDHFGVENV